MSPLRAGYNGLTYGPIRARQFLPVYINQKFKIIPMIWFPSDIAYWGKSVTIPKIDTKDNTVTSFQHTRKKEPQLHSELHTNTCKKKYRIRIVCINKNTLFF